MRQACRVIGVVALALGWLGGVGAAQAGPSPLRLGVSLVATGPDAQWGVPMLQGVQMAVEDVNRRGGAGGRPLETVVAADTAAPAQDTPSLQRAAVGSYERLLVDPLVLAVIGPQTSQEARVVKALLRRADLSTITPSATTFDGPEPAGGRPVYFRTVGIDLAQGDAMARFAHARLGVRRVVLVEDGSAFGRRMTDAFERRAVRLGITILARRLLDWQDADYRRELQDLSTLRPDALYAGVRFSVGVKLARGLPEALPDVRLLGTETLYDRAFPIQSRGRRAEGWYVPNVGPDPAMSPGAAAWAARYRARFGAEPSGYSLTAYTAVTVIADAIDRLARRDRPVTRVSVRDAIEATRLPGAPSGPVSFDRDGDLERAAVSIYQVRDGAFRHVETVLVDGVKVGGAAGVR